MGLSFEIGAMTLVFVILQILPNLWWIRLLAVFFLRLIVRNIDAVDNNTIITAMIIINNVGTGVPKGEMLLSPMYTTSILTPP